MAKAPKPANQGGIGKPHVAPPRITAERGKAPKGTPGLGPGHATNANKHTPGVGGSGTTHGSPKPFK